MSSTDSGFSESTAVWRRARAVFDEVADLTEPRRETELRRSCGDDRELLQAVRSLLDHDRDDEYLEAPWSLAGETPEEEWIGRRVGAYRLIREIGRGGSGIVFLAERDDAEFEQQVAVKVLDRSLTRRTRRLVSQERQILARLEHPSIARLIDGGSTPRGLPYVVMELVDGLPITTYCERHELSVEARLELFCEAAGAVQFAHRNLVVHRDLKPSNILVTAAGRVKLVDFGIAKILDAERGAEETQTATRILTPAYASPEQVLGQAITTSSDVYSLGIVLYELLTGRWPHGASAAELARVAAWSPPRPPSETVARSTRGSEERRAEIRLRRRLRGDLDHIVLRALREEPHRRYTSVEQLAGDVRRHLDGLPVEARRGTSLYRAGKFVRRHAAWVTAAAALLVLVLGFAAAALWQAVRRAEERDLAQRERFKAETVSGVMIDLFRLMDPASGQQYSEAAKEILDQGAERVARDFAAEPEMQATLMNALGSIYRSLAFLPEAEQFLDQAHALRLRIYGEGHTEVAKSLAGIGRLRRDQGRFPEAEALLREALEIQQRAFADGHLDIANNLAVLGDLLNRRGDYDAARQNLEEAVDLGRRLGDRQTASAAVRLNSLALVLRKQGETAEARRLYLEALAIFRRVHGDDHLNVATVLHNLALMANRDGDFEASAKSLREALAIYRRLHGDDHPKVQVIVANLAAALHQAGRYADAEPLYRETLEHRRKAIGEEHPDVALNLNNLGILLREMGRLAEARALLLEALAMRRRLLGHDHPDLASTLNNVGLVELDMGRGHDAEERFGDALDLARLSRGEHHRMVGISLGNLAKAALANSQPDLALERTRQAEAIFAQTLAEDHWRRADVRSVQGAALGELGRTDEAKRLLVRSLALLEKAKGKDSRAARDAAARLSHVLGSR